MRYVAVYLFMVTPVFAQDACSVALRSNAFNTFDQTVSNSIAFEKKEDLCRRNYSNKEEFRNSARSGGFSLSYGGLGLGASGGKSAGSGKVHFREEKFCESSQDEFSQEYFSNTSVRVADVALRAWSECIANTRKNSLWLEYKVADDGTGMTGTIYRTISSGPTTLKITSMQVHPSDLSNQVNCSIENKLWTAADFAKGETVTTDTTKEIVACTKPKEKTVRIAFGTDGDSLTWIEMPSVGEAENNQVEELRTQLLALSSRLTSTVNELKATDEAIRQEPTLMDQLRMSPQIQAQAACVAIGAGSGRWITAIPRTCNADTSSCEEICSSIKSRTSNRQILNSASLSVIGALHIYKNSPTSTIGKVGLKTYSYSSGDWSRRFCGPNYCCCSAR